MTTDGLFTIHSVTIPVKQNQPIKLIPFGDIHADSDLHAVDEWMEFIDYARKEKDAYFLGMGDYLDSWSASERHILRSGGLHDTSLKNLEKDARKRVADFCKQISFMKGRCLGIISGNHKPEFSDGTNGDHLIAAALGTKYLGVASAIHVSLHVNGKEPQWSFDVFAHHGKGGSARTVGGTLNTVAQVAAYMDCEIYLMGHDHQRAAVPLPPLLGLRHNSRGEWKLAERDRWVGRTGSFLKAYVDGQSSYNVDAGRGPCSIGHIEFTITPGVKITGRDRPDRVAEFFLKIRGTG